MSTKKSFNPRPSRNQSKASSYPATVTGEADDLRVSVNYNPPFKALARQLLAAVAADSIDVDQLAHELAACVWEGLYPTVITAVKVALGRPMNIHLAVHLAKNVLENAHVDEGGLRGTERRVAPLVLAKGAVAQPKEVA